MEITFFQPEIGSALLDSKSCTLQHHYKSRLVSQDSTSVVIYIYPLTFFPSKLKLVPEFLGVRESHKMRLEEFYAHVGYLQRAPNVTGEKCKLHFSPTGDQTHSAGLKVLHFTALL